MQTEFREDLKGLTRQAGCANKPTVFLFDETQIVYETFLEDVNNILTSGEVRHGVRAWTGLANGPSRRAGAWHSHCGGAARAGQARRGARVGANPGCALGAMRRCPTCSPRTSSARCWTRCAA